MLSFVDERYKGEEELRWSQECPGIICKSDYKIWFDMWVGGQEFIVFCQKMMLIGNRTFKEGLTTGEKLELDSRRESGIINQFP